MEREKQAFRLGAKLYREGDAKHAGWLPRRRDTSAAAALAQMIHWF
jgi:hypothetical protein